MTLQTLQLMLVRCAAVVVDGVVSAASVVVTVIVVVIVIVVIALQDLKVVLKQVVDAAFVDCCFCSRLYCRLELKTGTGSFQQSLRFIVYLLVCLLLLLL